VRYRIFVVLLVVPLIADMWCAAHKLSRFVDVIEQLQSGS
jgi:hypothetical protein